MAVADPAKLREKLLPHPRRTIDEPVLAVSLDRSDASGAREWMSAVRRADPQNVGVEVMSDLVAHDRAAQRHVARGNALRERHDVGNDALVVGSEPLSGAPESGHDLVEH